MKNFAKIKWSAWKKVLSTLCERFPDSVKTKKPVPAETQGRVFITDLNFRVSLVFGVQDLVRLVAVGLAEVVGIQRLDDRIFVRLSELGFLIGVVDRFGSERLNVDVVAHARLCPGVLCIFI